MLWSPWLLLLQPLQPDLLVDYLPAAKREKIRVKPLRDAQVQHTNTIFTGGKNFSPQLAHAKALEPTIRGPVNISQKLWGLGDVGNEDGRKISSTNTGLLNETWVYD